jgi:hypothetical protein
MYICTCITLRVCVCVCIVFCAQEDADDVSADDVETALLQLNVAGKPMHSLVRGGLGFGV